MYLRVICDSFPPLAANCVTTVNTLLMSTVLPAPEVLLLARVRVVPAATLVAGIYLAPMGRHGHGLRVGLEDVHLVAGIVLALRVAVTATSRRVALAVGLHRRDIKGAVLSAREGREVDIHGGLPVEKAHHGVLAIIA